MADIYAQLQRDAELIEIDARAGYIFSADDLQRITDWSPQVIEDYLTKTESIILIGGVDLDIIKAIEDLKTRVEDLEEKVSWLTPASASINSDFTTSGNQFIFCTNQRPNLITVTLNATPLDAERVWITRGDYIVNINGNSRTINGSFEIKMQRKNETRAIEYNQSIDAWVVV